MKYHPATNTIVPPFNEYQFNQIDLRPLVVSSIPAMQGGDTVLAKTPYLDGQSYRLDYCLLVKNSPAQIAYFANGDAQAAIAIVEGL